MQQTLSQDIERLLEQLSLQVEKLVTQIQDNPIDEEANLQLRVLSKAIEKLESQGISIPAGLMDEKSRLLRTVSATNVNIELAKNTHDRLSSIVLRLRSILPARNKKERAGRKNRNRLDQDTVAKEIVQCLRQYGSPVRISDIRDSVYDALHEQMQPADFEVASYNNVPFWENQVSRTIRKLRLEGIIKPATIRGCPELEEIYYENQTPYD